jgi:uncharacterized protein YecE (DUF72 family)
VPGQLDLFGAPPPAPKKAAVELVPPSPALAALAARLPEGVRLGTSSWSFPGWSGTLWERPASETLLAREGLLAYARHPLLRTVGIDRSFYGPLTEAQYAAYAGQVPPGFRFLVKAHEALTVERWPDHPRGGALRGQSNPKFLDAAYAMEAVVGPLTRGLGASAGPIVFQFPPQPLASTHGPERLAQRLHDFLAALPKGPLYAVELRNGELLGPALDEALRSAGAALCYAAWQHLPPLSQQARRVPPDRMPALVIRWMLPRGRNYEAQREAFAPFDRLQEEDPGTRSEVADLVRGALARGQGAWVTVNNKAEGCAPQSVFKLAEELALDR